MKVTVSARLTAVDSVQYTGNDSAVKPAHTALMRGPAPRVEAVHVATAPTPPFDRWHWTLIVIDTALLSDAPSSCPVTLYATNVVPLTVALSEVRSKKCREKYREHLD